MSGTANDFVASDMITKFCIDKGRSESLNEIHFHANTGVEEEGFLLAFS